MSNSSSNNKTIAKNTAYMYLRMLLIMIVSLYTSRVVLQVLGEDDYGTYSIVGGVVVLFTFISNAMATGTQRHLSYELGKSDGDLPTVFTACFRIQLWSALIIWVIAETVGLWFLNTQMNFPHGRMPVVNWIYQFSIITCLISVLQTTMTASIISYEKMSFYAYLSVIDAFIKLAVVFALQLFSIDKLWLYCLLIIVAHLIMFGLYSLYAFKKLPGIKLVRIKDTSIYRRFIKFSGWSLFGSIANVGYQQGINVIVNIFFGVTLNAAIGIANQINSAVTQFVTGFQQALNPQLVQTEASKNRIRQLDLIYKSSKYSFFIMFLLSYPLMVNLKYVLTLWLVEYPTHTESLSVLIIVGLMISCLSGPLWVSIYATGEIKQYQIVVSIVMLTVIPIAYFIGKMGGTPEAIFVARAMCFVFVLLVQLCFLRKLIDLQIRDFLQAVILPVSVILVLSCAFYYINHLYTPNADSLGAFICQTLLYETFIGLLIWTIGLKKTERKLLVSFVLSHIKK